MRFCFRSVHWGEWYTGGVEDVPRHPRLQKRGSRYFLRVKVPTHLRSAMGKREIRKALGTSDPREALKRVRKASMEADAVFETTGSERLLTHRTGFVHPQPIPNAWF